MQEEIQVQQEIFQRILKPSFFCLPLSPSRSPLVIAAAAKAQQLSPTTPRFSRTLVLTRRSRCFLLGFCGLFLAPWEGSEVYWAGVSKKIRNHKRKRFNLELPARFLNTSLSLVFLEAKGNYKFLSDFFVVSASFSFRAFYWLVSFELHFGSSHLDSQKGDCLE